MHPLKVWGLLELDEVSDWGDPTLFPNEQIFRRNLADILCVRYPIFGTELFITDSSTLV